MLLDQFFLYTNTDALNRYKQVIFLVFLYVCVSCQISILLAVFIGYAF